MFKKKINQIKAGSWRDGSAVKRPTGDPEEDLSSVISTHNCLEPQLQKGPPAGPNTYILSHIQLKISIF